MTTGMGTRAAVRRWLAEETVRPPEPGAGPAVRGGRTIGRLMRLLLLVAVAATLSGQPRHLGKTLAEWRTDLASSRQIERLLAARSIGEMAVAGRAGAAEAVGEALRHEDGAVRYWAAVASIHLPSPAPRPTDLLREALLDPVPEVQVQAARALVGTASEAEALKRLEALLAHRNRGVRLQAAHAADAIGSSAAPLTGALRRAMEDEFDYVQRVARHALWALGERPCPYQECE